MDVDTVKAGEPVSGGDDESNKQAFTPYEDYPWVFYRRGPVFPPCQDMLLDLAIIHSTLITPLYNLPI